MDQVPTLEEFLPKRSKVIFLTDAGQVNKDENHVILAGAGWCGYSQLGVPQFNSACDDIDKKKGTCYVADVTVPESKQAIIDLGLKPEAYPDHFIFDASKNEYEEVVGMLRVPQFKEKFKSIFR